VAAQGHGPRPRPLPDRTSEAERAAHQAFLQANLKDRSLWQGYGLELEERS
jgi:DNA polymerase-3 subunit epsilon